MRRPGNANLPIGDAQTANQEIGVPGLQPTRFEPIVSCHLSEAMAGSPRNDGHYNLIHYGCFSDSVARQERSWRGINFLLPTGGLVLAGSH